MDSVLTKLKDEATASLAKVVAQQSQRTDLQVFSTIANIEMTKDKIATRLRLDLGAEVENCTIDYRHIDTRHDVLHHPTRVILRIDKCAPIQVYYQNFRISYPPSISVPIYGIRVVGENQIVISDIERFHSIGTLGQAIVLAEIEGAKLPLGKFANAKKEEYATAANQWLKQVADQYAV